MGQKGPYELGEVDRSLLQFTGEQRRVLVVNIVIRLSMGQQQLDIGDSAHTVRAEEL